MLTTQDPHSVGEGMHVGAYPDDTNTTTGVPLVFTRDPVPESPAVDTHPTSVEVTVGVSVHPVAEISSATEEPSSSTHFLSEWLKL